MTGNEEPVNCLVNTIIQFNGAYCSFPGIVFHFAFCSFAIAAPYSFRHAFFLSLSHSLYLMVWTLPTFQWLLVISFIAMDESHCIVMLSFVLQEILENLNFMEWHFVGDKKNQIIHWNSTWLVVHNKFIVFVLMGGKTTQYLVKWRYWANL